VRPTAAMTILWLAFGAVTYGQPPRPEEGPPVHDAKVKALLEARRGTWHDMNVPESDGKLLYDLVVKNQYKDILEIGTSTGHSTIWLAWAASKTGGKVTTIEIDEGRRQQAIANLTEAGLQHYVDSRLGDAHKLVKELKGPFDFVFSDADKEWYKNYFVDVYPKLKEGGCFTAHNVSMRHGRMGGGIQKFLDHLKTVPGLKTTINTGSRAGVSISYKPKNGEGEEAWQSIFNGKDLTGWDGDPRLWSVKDGAIHGETTAENRAQGNTFLIWKGGVIKDFRLSLSFRCTATNNSGIQYRSKHITEGRVGNDWVVRGYQHEIRNQTVLPSVAGFIYEEGGKLILDCTDNHPEFALREGILALQLHAGKPMWVEFKDIRLQHLPDDGRLRASD